MKRLLCFALIFIIIFNSVVYADGLLIPDENHTFYGVNTNRYYSTKDEAVRAEVDFLLANGEPNFWLFLSTTLGIVNSGDVIGSLKEIFNSDYDDLVKEIDISDKGQLKFTASTLVKLRNQIEEEMKSKEPYKIYYPAHGNDYTECYIVPTTPEVYSAFRERFDGMQCKSFSPYWWYFLDGNKYKYAYFSGSNICFVDNELKAADAYYSICFYQTDLYETTDFSDEHLLSYSSSSLVSSVTGTFYEDTVRLSHANYSYGTPLVIFNSFTDLYEYVNSKPTAYYTTDYYNKTYQDITLNQETIKNYTTENIQNIYNTINNNADDALTQDELQKIIDSTVTEQLDKINGSLGDVNDNLEGVNAALDKVLTSLERSNEELKTQTSWLEKIYRVLERMDETLLVISSDLDEILEDDGLLDQNMNYTSLLNVLNIFLYGVPEPEEEPQTLSVQGEGMDMVVEQPVLMSAYSTRSSGGVVGLIFDKFPFCVPWDIYYCFLSLAESPEAPEFTFPFVIDSMGFRYEFTFNLKRFSMLSELSRMFLTLTFVVYMTHLTKKVVSGK